jgi:hypothetical protein
MDPQAQAAGADRQGSSGSKCSIVAGLIPRSLLRNELFQTS